MGIVRDLWSAGRLEIAKAKIEGGYKFTVGGLEFPFLRTLKGEFTCPGLGTVKTLVEARRLIAEHVEKHG